MPLVPQASHGTPRRVDPKIDPLDQFLGQHHVVVVEEDHAPLNLGALDEILPLLDQALVREDPEDELFPRGLTEQDASRIGEQPHQPLGIVQKKIGALIGGKTARKSQGQHIFIEDAGGIRRICAFRGELALVPLAHPLDQAFSPCCAQLPQLLIGDLADVIFDRTISTPTLHAASGGP
jgi:hypothetical protein